MLVLLLLRGELLSIRSFARRRLVVVRLSFGLILKSQVRVIGHRE